MKIDCDTRDDNPNLEFVIGGETYVLEPSDYILEIKVLR
jgi:hypothetical protein